MRVLVIGATGTIGSAVSRLLSTHHEVVRVGSRKGDFRVDLASSDSITRLYESVGAFDAVVSAAGVAKLAGLDELQDADYHTVWRINSWAKSISFGSAAALSETTGRLP